MQTTLKTLTTSVAAIAVALTFGLTNATAGPVQTAQAQPNACVAAGGTPGGTPWTCLMPSHTEALNDVDGVSCNGPLGDRSALCNSGDNDGDAGSEGDAD